MMSPMRGGAHRWRVFAGLAALAVLATACGGPDGEAPQTEPAADPDDPAETQTDMDDEESTDQLDSLVSAAQEEGELFWYSVPKEGIAQDISDAFSEKYGIEVEFIRGGSSSTRERFGGEAEAGATVADLVLISNSPWNDEGIEKGWFIDIAEADIPGIPEDIPEDFRRPDAGSAVAGIDPFAIAYNTELVSPDEVPSDWEDLLDERWTGEILLIDPDTTSYTWAWSAVESKYGESLIADLGEQVVPRLYPLLSPLLEALAAGEGAIGIPPAATSVADAKASGLPVDFVLPEFAWATEYIVGLSADAPNPNAARLFTHFLYLGEGQDILAGVDGMYSPFHPEDIPGELAYGPPDEEQSGPPYSEKFGVFE